MLENPAQSPAAAADSAPVIRRYAPPNQRNRSLSRRKSGERFDRINHPYGVDGEKNQYATSRNITNNIDHGDAGSSHLEKPGQKLIPLEGFSRSEAAQLLRNRWRSAIHSYNDASIDLSERPTMYMGNTASAWEQFRLPHQMMAPTSSHGSLSGTQMDFLAELNRKMKSADAGFDN